jgi:hypothetical protein
MPLRYAWPQRVRTQAARRHAHASSPQLKCGIGHCEVWHWALLFGQKHGCRARAGGSELPLGPKLAQQHGAEDDRIAATELESHAQAAPPAGGLLRRRRAPPVPPPSASDAGATSHAEAASDAGVVGRHAARGGGSQPRWSLRALLPAAAFGLAAAAAFAALGGGFYALYGQPFLHEVRRYGIAVQPWLCNSQCAARG